MIPGLWARRADAGPRGTAARGPTGAHAPNDLRIPAGEQALRVSANEAAAVVRNGSTVLVGGWGSAGIPRTLLRTLGCRDLRDLTVVSNNCGTGEEDDVGCLFVAGQVRKAIASFPTNADEPFRAGLVAREVELELVPQGTLAERLRAAGAGLGGFFTPTGAETMLAEGKEVRYLAGRPQVFEAPLPGDFALIHAWQADPYGNLRFRYVGRAFNSVMAAAATVTIVEVEEFMAESLDPQEVDTPGMLVNILVEAGGA